MTTYIVLLRGVMPTGRNRVPMAPLRAALERVGLRSVRTYIQTGNVIAQSPLGRAAVEQLVHETIESEFGADIAVVARTRERFAAIVERCPFTDPALTDANPVRLYFFMLAADPGGRAAQAFRNQDFRPDRMSLAGDVVYALYATKFSDSRFTTNRLERLLGVAVTARNINTIRQLRDLSGDRT